MDLGLGVDEMQQGLLSHANSRAGTLVSAKSQGTAPAPAQHGYRHSTTATHLELKRPRQNRTEHAHTRAVLLVSPLPGNPPFARLRRHASHDLELRKDSCPTEFTRGDPHLQIRVQTGLLEERLHLSHQQHQRLSGKGRKKNSKFLRDY